MKSLLDGINGDGDGLDGNTASLTRSSRIEGGHCQQPADGPQAASARRADDDVGFFDA